MLCVCVWVGTVLYGFDGNQRMYIHAYIHTSMHAPIHESYCIPMYVCLFVRLFVRFVELASRFSRFWGIEVR